MLKSLELKQGIQALRNSIMDATAKGEDATSKAKELEALMAEYSSALDAENEKRKNLKGDKKMSMSMTEKRQGFNRVLKNLLTGKAIAEADKQFMPKVVDTATGQYAGENVAGGYLIPEEFLEAYSLNEGMVNLASLVDQVSVSYPSGKIPTIDYSQVIELADFVNDNDKEIARKSAVFGQTSFSLNTRGALIAIARELIQDSATDVVAVINRLFARAEIETCNKDIITACQASGVNVKTDVDFTKNEMIDAIIEALDSTLDMTYAPNAKILMCQKDWVAVQTLKDADGQYYVQPIITEAGKFAIHGHEVVVVPNKYFTTGEDESKKIGGTIIVGDFKQLKKMIRVGYEVSADESAGFTRNSIMIRAIARFCIKNMYAKAFVKITAKA